jgi:hypothetical protein
MQEKNNAPNDNQPKITKSGRPEEANFVKKQVSQLNFQRTEIPNNNPPPKPILHIRWAREADDADHKEEAPVDWVHEGRDDEKRGEGEVCVACASVVV